MVETWVPIKGYEGLYEVSDLGRVYSLGRTIRGVRQGTECDITYKPKILKAYNHKGYKQVSLWKDGALKTAKVHLLVAKNFLEPVPGKTFVLHGRRGSLCNEVWNLRYGTASENTLDRHLDGTFPNTLPDETVAEIRHIYANSELNHVHLADLYSISTSSVSRIVRRESYKHVV